MLSTPRTRSACSVGAAIESGTSINCSSRFIAVTVTASSSSAVMTKSTWASASAATCTPVFCCVRTPGSDADTVYVPAARPVRL